MKPTLLLASLAIAAVASAAGQTFLEETFSDSNWEDRWTTSSSRDDLGKLALSSGTFYPNKEYAQGLQTTEDHRFYSVSTPFSTVADNSKEDLIIQYTVKQEVAQECGGAYLKLLPEGYDAKNFNGDSEYAIMFGPDVCGSDNRVHIIFNYKGKNYLTKHHYSVHKDSRTHFYRLTVHPDQKYSLNIDGELDADHIPLEEHWDIYPARTIPDPEDKKPEDWVDAKEIEDPTHVKPANYDDIPRYIADPDATQPEDWDPEADGEWEAAEIANPDFEEWEPKYLPNPAYKGEWKAKDIPNPEFKEDSELAHYKIAGLGFDLWQVKSGTIFDDVIVTSDADVANKYLENWKKNSEEEKKLQAEAEAKKEKEKKEAAEKEAAEKEAAEKESESKESDDKHDELDEEDSDKKAEPKAEEVKQEAAEDKAAEEVKPVAEEPKEEVKATEPEVKEEVKEEVKATEPEAKEEVKETKKETKEETKHDEL